MKRYLFDKIRVGEDGVVRFIPFRKATMMETFFADKHSTLNQNQLEFKPTSFNEFLTMLKKTIVNENGDYNIALCVAGREEHYSFHSLLDSFCSEMFFSRPTSAKAIKQFKISAYKIKEDTVKELAMLKSMTKNYEDSSASN